MNVPRGTRLEFSRVVIVLPTLRNTPFREREICGRDGGIQPSVGVPIVLRVKSFLHYIFMFVVLAMLCLQTDLHASPTQLNI